jgi:hypothetical protein
VRALALAAVALLGACAGQPRPVGPGVGEVIRAHHAAHAVEQAGRCPDAVIEGPLETRVLAEEADRLLVRIGYRYRDRERDDGSLPRQLPGEVPTELTCRGFAERDVTLVREAAGWRVVEMSGDFRG